MPLANDNSRPAQLDELVALVAPKEETILWVGAGASIPAGHPAAGQLVDILNEEAKPDGGLPPCSDFLQAADAFIEVSGQGRLSDLLQETFGASLQPTVVHRALARLIKAGCFRTIITTNYDDLLERAIADEGIRCIRQVREDNINVLDGGGVRLLKPHGDRGNWSRVVLSGDSYRRFEEENSRLVPQLDALLKKHPVFFVGYSMMDPRTLGWLADLNDSERAGLKRWRPLLTEQSWSLAKGSGGTSLTHATMRALLVDNYEEHLPALLTDLADAYDPPTRSSFRIEIRGDTATWSASSGGTELATFADPAPFDSELAGSISKLRELSYRPVPTDEQGGLTDEGARFGESLRQGALEVGAALTESLLSPDAARDLAEATTAAQASRPVLLEVAVEATNTSPEAERYADHILGLPWELLCLNGRFPVEDGTLDIVREALVPALKGLEPPISPLMVVATVAAPEDTTALDYEGECYRLWKALGSSDERLQLTDRGTLAELVSWVTAVRPTVVHFTGHGAPGALLFEDEYARKHEVKTDELLRRLASQPQPHTPSLIYLASCHGASTTRPPTRSDVHPKRTPRFDSAATETAPSTAAALHRSRFSQVVAYFGPVGDEQSTRLEAAFYGGLANGLTATESLRAARSVSTDSHRDATGTAVYRYPMGWSQIVLYHRGAYVPTALTSKQAGHRSRPGDSRKKRLSSRLDRSSSKGGVQRLDFGFVGRRSLRARLLRHWSPEHDNQRVMVVAGLGGLGKSALCAEVLPILSRYLGSSRGSSAEVMTLDARTLRDEPKPIEGLWAQVAEFQPQGGSSDGREWQAALASAQERGLTGLGLAHAVTQATRLAGGLLVYIDDAESLQAPLGQEGDGNIGEWRDDHVACFWNALVEAAHDPDPKQGSFGLLASARYVPKELKERDVLHIDAMRGVDLRRLMTWFETLSKLPKDVRESLAERVDGHPRTVEFLDGLISRELEDELPKRRGHGYDPATLDWEKEVIAPALDGLAVKLDSDLLLPKLWDALKDEERELLGRCLALTGPGSHETLSVLGSGESILALERMGLLSPGVSREGVQTWAPHHIVRNVVREKWRGDLQRAHSLLGHHFKNRVDSNERVAVLDATRAVEHLSLAGEGTQAWTVAVPLLIYLRKQGRFLEALRWCQLPLNGNLGGPQRGIALAWKSQLSVSAGVSPDGLEDELRLALTLVEEADRPFVLSELGGLMQRLGRLRDAETYEREDLALSTQLLGNDHPSTLASMANLAHTLWAQGDHTGARQLEEQVLEVTRRVRGDEHPDTLAMMNNLAGTLNSQGDHAGARQLQEQALEVRRRVLGDEHPDTLLTMGNLAHTLAAQGDRKGARQLLKRVLEMRRRVLGDEHPHTLLTMNNLAETLNGLGDYTGARQLQEQALEVMRRVLGDEHPGTLTTMHNLAGTISRQGDHTGGRQLLEQVLEVTRRVHGDEHPHTLTTMHNLAGTISRQGDHTGGRQLLEQVLEVTRRVRGDEHPDTLAMMNNLAGTLNSQGDHAGARQLQEQALEVMRRVLGDEHPDTLTTMANLAVTLLELGDKSAAHGLVAEAVVGAKQTLGDEHPTTRGMSAFLQRLKS